LVDSGDVVLKLSTGAGKTTVALVHLYAYMLESRRPCVYVCPRRQLVRQVLQEAQALGVPAVEYPPDQSHPAPEGLRGEAILVCTYDKMFNGKTTFRRDDVRLVPHAVVLDDAHAGIEEVRDNFTLRLPVGSAIHAAVLDALLPARKYLETRWIYIDRQDPSALLEVPFWIWSELHGAVTEAIAQHADASPYVFVWPHLRERLRWCRCFVNGDSIEIGATLPFLDDFQPYSRAKHRLFASATLSDDSLIVRELGCAAEAAISPVLPKSDAGVGERMVIAPSLIDHHLNRAWVMQWAKAMSNAYRVVVLCPSEKRANEWSAVGAQVVLGENVDGAVESLRNGTLNFVAFAQRYDGVDLPDDACRFLVLDGVPQAVGLAERHDSAGKLRGGPDTQPTIHRIEQGMGRAVRSHVDFAVVVLAGEDLAAFVSDRDVELHMGRAARAQIDLAHDLARMARENIALSNPADRARELALTCLRRDAAWKQFYDEQVRQVVRAAQREVNQSAIEVAAAERAALNAALSGDTRDAAEKLQPALNKSSGDGDKGRMLERLAGLQWNHDRDAALRTQQSAYQLNTHVAQPPTGWTPRRGASATHPQATNTIRWFRKFSKPGAAVAEVVALRPRLAFSSKAKAFEAALRDLGEILGAFSSRPEEEANRGPDNLWDWAPVAWVIEAKNERSKLPKDDGEQLLASVQWLEENYPERCAIPVVVSAVVECEWDAMFPSGTRVLHESDLNKILDNLQAYVAELAEMDPQTESEAERVRTLLTKHALGQEQLLGRYTQELRKRPRT
jgi:hypothetical protein